ncbi:hypothetical protein [Streptomyces sp. CA-106131]|uniref:hypothetical protein n=1 Tax=Streptomyces sp. CA-106131 TaxID=3240045 RepID=UPI003D941165
MHVARTATAVTQPAADDPRGRITGPNHTDKTHSTPPREDRAAAARPPIHRGIRRQPFTAHE